MRFIVGICLLLFAVTCSAATNKFKTEGDVLLRGKLIQKTYTIPESKPQKAYVLVLSSPITVEKDETGGPANDVRLLQVVFLNDINGKGFLNKQVQVSGSLFHAVSAQHYEKALIAVKKIVKK